MASTIEYTFPTLPAPVCGMAGWGVPNPHGGDYLSDGYDSPEDATTAAQAAYVYLATGKCATLDEACQLAATMMSDEPGEWSDMSKDRYGFRIRTVEGLYGVRADYWAERYQYQGGHPPLDDEPSTWTPQDFWQDDEYSTGLGELDCGGC